MTTQTQTQGPNLGMEVTTFENPMGINGFEFVEFAAPQGEGPRMRKYLEQLGFTAVAKHRERAITLFRQGTINFLLNEQPDSFASDFAAEHGPSADPAMIGPPSEGSTTTNDDTWSEMRIRRAGSKRPSPRLR